MAGLTCLCETKIVFRYFKHFVFKARLYKNPGFYDKIRIMIVSETQINPTIARQILQEAEQNGVSVEVYLKEIAKENSSNGQHEIPKVRKIETKIDLSREREWLEQNKNKYLGQWVVLDGNRLIGAGNDPIPFIKQARSEGVKSPFMRYIDENDSEPFSGGWY